MTSSIFLFKALGEETKHKILRTLLNGEICACKIPVKIGKTQSNTSMHLAKLGEWNLIKSRRKGKMILYSIKDKRVLNIFKIIEKGGEK
jgi:ArsR family transcriptional regulator, lead/cadmium/zinc/bismuth-responsive transcriptional repressor